MTPEELLSQLKDIHDPAAIGYWPLAPGWWVVIVSTILLVIAIVYFWQSQVKKNAWKKDARRSLKEIKANSSTLSHHQSLHLINQLIKRVACHKLNDPSVKTLTGEQWSLFLDSFLNTDTPKLFATEQLELLAEGEYQKHADSNDKVKSDITVLLNSLNTWIKEA